MSRSLGRHRFDYLSSICDADWQLVKILGVIAGKPLIQARISFTTRASSTPVRRKSRPWDL